LLLQLRSYATMLNDKLLVGLLYILLNAARPSHGANECNSTLGFETGDVCRPAVSVCDIEEVCNTTLSADCPPDEFQPNSTVVHPSTSVDGCDPEETCSGVDATVPPDVNDCVKIDIKVLGQSGKFTIYDEDLGEEDPNKVTVQLDYLYEIAADGETKVGNTGNPKHSVETFANQQFVIEDPVDTTIGNVGAQLISFYSSVNGIGNIELDTYILKSNGTIGTDEESWAVRANDVKFSIALREWEFCAPCGNGNNQRYSEYIDVAVEIKGKGGAPEKSNETDTSYDLGGGVPLEMSNRINLDGNWTAMPDGYPKMEEKGSKALFIFRFPKFEQNATYDPVIGYSNTYDEEAVGDDSDSSGPSAVKFLGRAFGVFCLGLTTMLLTV